MSAPTCQRLEIAIEGDGLSPDDVPLRALAELIEASASALEAVAAATGVQLPRVALIAVRTGSAAYQFASSEPEVAAVFERFEVLARERGKTATPGERRALARLHKAGRLGALRLGRVRDDGTPLGTPVHMASPITSREHAFESVEEVTARVVGVFVVHEQTRVKLRLDDAATEEFSATSEVAERAAALFNRSVRATVAYRMTDEAEPVWIESIEPADARDPLAAIEAAREELRSRGLVLSAADWFAEGED